MRCASGRPLHTWDHLAIKTLNRCGHHVVTDQRCRSFQTVKTEVCPLVGAHVARDHKESQSKLPCTSYLATYESMWIFFLVAESTRGCSTLHSPLKMNGAPTTCMASHTRNSEGAVQGTTMPNSIGHIATRPRGLTMKAPNRSG